eukprot:ANDGO_08636.mRNA.1 hypothetical protein
MTKISAAEIWKEQEQFTYLEDEMLRIVDSMNRFASAVRLRLQVCNEKIDLLERHVTYLEHACGARKSA